MTILSISCLDTTLEQALGKVGQTGYGLGH